MEKKISSLQVLKTNMLDVITDIDGDDSLSIGICASIYQMLLQVQNMIVNLEHQSLKTN